MEALLKSDHFWSAVKRKAMIEVLAIVFEGTEAGDILSETTRLTDAAIKRVRETADSEPIEEPQVKEETALIALHEKVTDAIAAGDHKKAKKAFKKLKETGIDGSEIKALKKAVKELK